MSRTQHGRKLPFAAIPNATIDDAGHLDFMALGLLNVLLRQNDGWDMTLERVGKKYGYGRDAMANAMGLLQAARYVVKVRIQSDSTAQWSTEIVTYDTPALDEEIEDLVDRLMSDEGIKAVQVIEPTPSAVKRSAARQELLGPRKRKPKVKPAAKTELPPRTGEPTAGKPALGNNPETARSTSTKAQVMPEYREIRQSAQAAVSKKTVREEDFSSSSCAPGGAGAEPSGGASGEEEEFSSNNDKTTATAARKAAVRPPDGLAPAPGSSETPGVLPGRLRAAEPGTAMCRGCWSPFRRLEGSGATHCPDCG